MGGTMSKRLHSLRAFVDSQPDLAQWLRADHPLIRFGLLSKTDSALGYRMRLRYGPRTAMAACIDLERTELAESSILTTLGVFLFYETAQGLSAREALPVVGVDGAIDWCCVADWLQQAFSHLPLTPKLLLNPDVACIELSPIAPVAIEPVRLMLNRREIERECIERSRGGTLFDAATWLRGSLVENLADAVLSMQSLDAAEYARQRQADQAGPRLALPKPEYQRLALCMIVKDEADVLADCLASVAGVVDEIIIADTGSTDDSRDIARMFGARVIEIPWLDDFGAARNAALEHVTADWVLVLDADEVLTPNQADSLRWLISLPTPNPLAYQLRIRNAGPDGSIDGGIDHLMPRLFPCGHGLRWRGVVHEQLVTESGEYVPLIDAPQVVIEHWGYTSERMEAKDKHNRTKGLLEKAIEADPASPFNWFNLGVSCRTAGDTDQAIDAFNRCIALADDQSDRFFIGAAEAYRVGLLVNQSQPATALAMAEGVSDAALQMPEYWLSVGWAHLCTKQPHRAIDAFEQALMLGGNLPIQDRSAATWKPQIGLWRAWTQIDRPDLAEQALTAAAAIAPHHPTILEALATQHKSKAPA